MALDEVDVAFEQGTIHAVVGENGAGKSTLGRLIAGVVTPDSGRLSIDGENANLRSPRDALDRGITMVAQELSLVPTLSVLDNVFLGIEATKGPFLFKSRNQELYDEITDRYTITADADERVDRLSGADQQKVEILRALARDARLIVMDEPTARLTSVEARNLRETVRRLKEQGVTVIFVSHFVEEVLDVADVITIMRDGRVVRTSPADTESRDSLIEGIVGRSLDAAFPPRVPPQADADRVLELDRLSRNGAFSDVTLTVRAGEIVALAGIIGAGRTDVARTIFGADAPTSGLMRLNGQPFRPRSPSDAIRSGVAMIPESRRTQGLFPLLAVRPNLTMPHLRDMSSPGGFIYTAVERTAAQKTSETIGLTGAGIEDTMEKLSGGNQQKTLFGRWVMARPALLVADEPTRGVDVGAKRSIYQLIVELAAEGVAILIVSSELEEVLGLSHRIVVMRGGKVRGELDGQEATEESVMKLALGPIKV